MAAVTLLPLGFHCKKPAHSPPTRSLNEGLHFGLLKPCNSQKKMETELDTAVAAGIDCIVSSDKDETTILLHKSIVVKQNVSFCANRLVWIE